MIVISNKQRDDIVRHLKILITQENFSRIQVINSKRIAKSLIKKLNSKETTQLTKKH